MNHLFHVTDTEKSFSVLTVNATEALQTMQKMHSLTKNGAKLLGQLLTAAALQASLLGETETLTVTAEGVGKNGTAVAIAQADGSVRGFFEEEAEPEQSEEKASPMLKVMRRTGLAEPRLSFCALNPQDMGKSFAEYYRACEQMQALCRLEVEFAEDSDEILFGGGVFFLPWTKTQGEEAAAVRSALETAELKRFLQAGDEASPVEAAFPNIEFLHRAQSEMCYRCTCSAERMQTALLSIGKAALTELSEDEFTEIHCNFCNQKYLFSRETIKMLLEQL